MQTRRDQLQAYRFLNRRALAALVTGEPNAVEPPMRRLTLTTISGIMIAVLVALGFALFGFLKPSVGNSWKDPGTIIIENETGANYVVLGGGLLHPVLNYPSSVLAVGGQSQAKVVHVDHSTLTGAKRGPTIGIPGLPTSLPSAGSLLKDAWTVCSRQVQVGASIQARVSVDIGQSVRSNPIDSGDAIVVSAAQSGSATPSQALLWAGKRFPIASQTVLNSLVSGQHSLVVGPAMLNSLPMGAVLRTPTVPDAGAPTTLAGQSVFVGQLVKVTAVNSTRTYVVLSTGGRVGLASVTPVQAALLGTMPLAGQLRSPVTMASSSVLDITTPSLPATVAEQFTGLPTGLPHTPDVAGQHGGVCARFAPGASTARYSVPPSELSSEVEPTGGVVTATANAARGIADQVNLSPGQAELVRPSDGPPTDYVVADPGEKYAFADAAAMDGFGYNTVHPLRLPVAVLDLVPAGPGLSPTAARKPVTG